MNKLNPTYDAYQKDIAIANFYFESSNVLQFRRAQRMTMIDYISQIGGLLGLGMGFSLVSGIEIIYWLTIRLFQNLRLMKPTVGDANTDEDKVPTT